MMKRWRDSFRTLVFPAAGILAMLLAGPAWAAQVLVSVGDRDITSADLEQAIASSPFATQFPAMDEGEQAGLRGDLLTRLVDAELLRREALAQGVDRSEDFARDVAAYRRGLLYQAYLDKLREAAAVPEDVERSYRERLKGEADALAAARSTFVAQRYTGLKAQRLKELKARYRVRIHARDLEAPAGPRALLAEGEGIAVTLADLGRDGARDTPQGRRERVEALLELLVFARAAEAEGIDVGAPVAAYRDSLLPRLLLEHQEAEWIPDEAVLESYFNAHPEIGRVPERRQIGQLVVAGRGEAEALRERILGGESLFTLAAEYSIDPYGRKHAGDMGWLAEGSGAPAIENALATLADGEVSAVVETPMGFHLLTIVARLPGRQKGFAAVRDRVRRALIQEHLGPYLETLRRRYPVQWHLAERRPPAAPATAGAPRP